MRSTRNNGHAVRRFPVSEAGSMPSFPAAGDADAAHNVPAAAKTPPSNSAATAGLRRISYIAMAMAVLVLALLFGPFGPLAGADEDESAPKIQDVLIYLGDTNTNIASYSSSNQAPQKITSKGGTLEFDSVVQWTDWTKDRNSEYVDWACSDASVATINSSGVLTAKGDGTVEVTATVAAEYSTTGEDMQASVAVTVTGQTDSRYVTKIAITDADGNDIGNSSYVIEEDLSTATAQFYAKVTVYDPATDSSTTYDTADGILSSQTDDLGDLTWYMSDTTMGDVDEDTGAFRPAAYGLMVLNVSSTAGKDNKTVRDKITIVVQDPNGGTTTDDYHPQETLTIKAYYEEYPPSDYSDDDAAEWVINKTYTLEDLEAMDQISAVYTALGDGNYFTITGTGVSLVGLLRDAGIDTDGVQTLEFGTADNLDRPVSWSYIVGSDRYYYPNVDINSYSGAVQVYPILALESCQVQNGSTEADYDDMTEATRFRLLFGSTGRSDRSSQYQIKWINTLYVELEGGPDVETGSEGDGSGSQDTEDAGTDKNVTGSDAVAAGSSDSEGGGSGSSSGSEGSGDSAGTADSADSDGESDGRNAGSADDRSSQDTASDGAGASGDSSGEGEFTIFQILNNNDSDTQTTIDAENPWRRLALPLCLLALLLGAFKGWHWYRAQTKPTMLAYPTGITGQAV